MLLEESEKIIQSEKIRYETKFIDMELKVVEYRDRVVQAEAEKKTVIQQVREL